MKVERTRDRVVITGEELQALLVQYIQDKLGRTPDGAVHFESSERDFTFKTSAYAHLQFPEAEPLFKVKGEAE